MTTFPSLLPLPVSAPADAQAWRIDLDQTVPPAAQALLSPAEDARARRFVFARDRERFIAAHVALRELLARHTGRPGGTIELAEGRFGKPVLAAPSGAHMARFPHFNLSHSQSVGVVALSDTAEIGIDVEALRPVPDATAMAQAYFAPAEQAALARLAARDANAAERAFLVCWTRKEACLKALGTGLQLATDGFEVGVDESAGAPCVVDIATPEGAQRLRLQSLACGADAVGALALRMARPTSDVFPACAGPHASKVLA